MAKPGARVRDLHECKTPVPKPHVNGPIAPPCSLDVEYDGRAAARASDRALCQVPPNFIVTGSGTVSVNGLPAARLDDLTMHPPPGHITTGSSDVLIGGPTIGVRLGGASAGNLACQGAASGRASGTIKQSYNNCGVESARQIINQATNKSISEDTLLDESIDAGDADKESTRNESGGTSPDGRQDILDRNGVPSVLVPATRENLTQAIAEHKGIISSHEVKYLWPDLSQTGGHAITVTGVGFDAHGQPETVYYNDTGRGQCQTSLPWSTFMGSLRPGRDMNVTSSPVW